ncbi:hypothetical protein [Halorussus sp. MSC15.2]|uniref:hypothetical protein n=1 Tax=Halorussus sp. MSC15.2 TaxID=2283638 RepID=UPI0013D36463|nr:hypothetical protein [Halorussus sp. MSC15.2]NEU56262.1 hypothetical protein [Halorussus sp. MSC15.2]
MSNNTDTTKRFAALVAALAVVASAFTGATIAASVTGNEGVVFPDPADNSTDDRTGIAVGVDAMNATTNVTIDSVTLNGTTVSTSYTVEQGTVATISTFSGNNTEDMLYVDIADVPLQGSVDVTYTVNSTQYTDTINYDIDSDDDGVSDSQDEYPDNAPQTVTHNRSAGESVESAYVEATSDGNVTVKVYDAQNGTLLNSYTTSVNISSSESSELVTVDVGDGNRTLDQYEITYEASSNVSGTGLIYQANSGSGSSSGSSSGLSGLSDAQLGGIVVVVAGAGLVLLKRD